VKYLKQLCIFIAILYLNNLYIFAIEYDVANQLFEIIKLKKELIQNRKIKAEDTFNNEMDIIINKFDGVRENAKEQKNIVIEGAAILQIASCHKYLGNYFKAMNYYRLITEQPKYFLNKTVSLAHLSLGYLAIRQSNYNEAKKNFNKIINQYPEEETLEEAKIWRAHTYALNKEFNRAKSYYKGLPDAQIFIAEMDKEIFINKEKEKYLASGKASIVGAVFSITGRAALLGDPQKKTAQMVADQINKAGGINGKKLKLIVYDTEGDATKANLAVKRLITQDKVCIVIGPSLSGTSLAVVPLAEKYKTPLISCAPSYRITWDEKTNKPRHWVFKTPQTDALAVEAIYAHLQKHGINKIAIMSSTSGFGKSGRGELVRLAPQYGMNIVADETYGPKDTDLTAQLTKIKGVAPDAIVNWSVGPTQLVVLRNWKDLGMTKILLYQSHGFGSRENIELAAGAAEGVYSPLGAVNVAAILPQSHPQKSVTSKYANDYAVRYNEPLSSFGGHAWDAMHLAIKALRAVGCNRAAIRDYLENNTAGFVGQHGVFNYSSEDHTGLDKDAFQIVVVKDGDWALAE
jgi:branched-chain amino acid transport system substrate-binding protein